MDTRRHYAVNYAFFHRTAYLLPHDDIRNTATRTQAAPHEPVREHAPQDEQKSSSSQVAIAKEKRAITPKISTILEEDIDNLLENLSALSKSVQVGNQETSLNVLLMLPETVQQDDKVRGSRLADACAFWMINIGEAIKHFNPDKEYDMSFSEEQVNLRKNIYEKYKILATLRDELIHHFPFLRINKIKQIFDSQIQNSLAQHPFLKHTCDLRRMPSYTLTLKNIEELLNSLKDNIRLYPAIFVKSKNKPGNPPKDMTLFSLPFFKRRIYEGILTMLHDPHLLEIEVDTTNLQDMCYFIYRISCIHNIIKDIGLKNKVESVLTKLCIKEDSNFKDDAEIDQECFSKLRDILRLGSDFHNIASHGLIYTVGCVFRSAHSYYHDSRIDLERLIKFMLEWEECNNYFANSISVEASEGISAGVDLSSSSHSNIMSDTSRRLTR